MFLFDTKINQTNLQQKIDLLSRMGCCGLATNIDGTLSPITPDPATSWISKECREALDRLEKSGRFEVISIISGRSALECRKLVGLSNLLYLGNHGLEILFPGSERVEPIKAARPYQSLIAGVLEMVKYNLLHYNSESLNYVGEAEWQQKLIFENKGITASIHYRQCANTRLVRQIILEQAGEVARKAGLRLAEGRKVVEIRPPVETNKGTALSGLVENYRLIR